MKQINRKDIQFSEMDVQEYTTNNQLYFDNTENENKQIIAILDIDKGVIHFLVKRLLTKGRKSVELFRRNLPTIGDAIEVYNKIELKD